MKKRTKSQVATIIIFIIAVLFLFALMSINISRIAQKKTNIDNIADGVGLQVASQLGSMANAIKHEFEIYGSGTKKCDVNWKLMGGIALVVIGAAGFLFTAGQSGWLAALGTGWILGTLVTGAMLTTQGVGLQFVSTSQGAQEALATKMQGFSALQQIIETPVQGTLFALADDPAWVRDEFDMDQDTDTQDLIPRFVKWYNLRLNSFRNLAVGSQVEDFYKGFFEDGNNKRFYIEEEDLLAKKGEDYVRWWVDSNGDGTRDVQDAKLVPWFRDELTGLLRVLRQYGYGINVQVDSNGKISRIDDSGIYRYEDMINGTWVRELEEFENTIVRSFNDIDFDSAVKGVNTWKNYLINKEYGGWYGRLINLRQRAQELMLTLQERINQIHQCVYSCERRAKVCSEDRCDNGPACRQDCDPTTYDADGNPIPGGCWDVAWEGCCGEMVYFGRKCPGRDLFDGCTPTSSCRTPLGGEKPCCELVDLEPYRSIKYGERDTPVEEMGNIINFYVNDQDDPVSGKRYDAIRILDEFISDTEDLNQLIFDFKTNLERVEVESYDRMHEGFYVWQDRVGGLPEGQLVGHIVYARIDGLDPKDKSQGGNSFKIPYADPTSEWVWQPPPLPPIARVCIELILPDPPEFTLTVARFDEDTAKMGPISRFRRFKFSRQGISKGDEEFIRSEAENFSALLNANQYPEVRDKDRFIRILRNYGIVTKVKVHYGPGETQKDQESVPAAQKNKDIYIMETSSNL